MLTVHVDGLAIARVVGIDTTDPTLQTRDSKGRWVERASISDRHASKYLWEYAELAAWIRAQMLRALDRELRPIERKLRNVEAMVRFMTYPARARARRKR
jgi:hypothetical protein